jgi:hypothetical protein
LHPARFTFDHERLNIQDKIRSVTHRLLFKRIKRDFEQMGFYTGHFPDLYDNFRDRFGFIFTGYILALR